MDELFNQDELSAEDQAILQAFDAMDLGDWESPTTETQIHKATRPLTDAELQADLLSPEEMLAIFADEAREDLAILQQTLRQLEPDDDIDVARLKILQRTAHKLKGTTGAMDCMAMSAIARHIESLITLITVGSVIPFIGLNALAQTVRALEMTLHSFLTDGVESGTPLAELEQEYQALNIDIHTSGAHVVPAGKGSTRDAFTVEDEEQKHSSFHTLYSSSTSFVRVDVRRFEQLVLHTERMAELSSPLEQAQAEVEKALQQLQVAQARLRYVEALLSTHLMAKKTHNSAGQANIDDRHTSSLVARILNESVQRTGHAYQRKSKFQPQPQKLAESLDLHELALLPSQGALHRASSSSGGATPTYLPDAPLDHPPDARIERFPENDVLVHSLGEAIADVATASSQLRIAFAQPSRLAQKQIEQAANVRNDTLLLRLTPISALCSRIERAVMMSTLAQQGKVLFEVKGETTEIDQDILEELKHPLLQLVRTCIATSFIAPAEPVGDVEQAAGGVESIWLHIGAAGNEVLIEVGFSMAVEGGALEEVQAAIRRLHGSISARRNAVGGISFYLRLPRSHGAVQSLLVRAGNHRLVVPFSQVQGIVDGRQNAPARGHDPSGPYVLNTLLGFPPDQVGSDRSRVSARGHPQEGAIQRASSSPGRAAPTFRPVLILQSETLSPVSVIAVQVDEIVGDVELVVKPLAPHLQRPGIAGAAISGMGDVLLVLDLPELVRHYASASRRGGSGVDEEWGHGGMRGMMEGSRPGAGEAQHSEQTQFSVLIADDSVYIRQSLHQTLGHAGYEVTEAVDGIEALECLLDNPPHVLLLDMEMPNLNGLDLLSMMRVHTELASVKVVMLTSRSSEKHRLRARELGAHAYLTKPCPQDLLLETLRMLLGGTR